jgi:hypothetical protein
MKPRRPKDVVPIHCNEHAKVAVSEAPDGDLALSRSQTEAACVKRSSPWIQRPRIRSSRKVGANSEQAIGMIPVIAGPNDPVGIDNGNCAARTNVNQAVQRHQISRPQRICSTRLNDRFAL